MRFVITFICTFFVHAAVFAQPQIVDEIVGLVGDEIILYSDIQIQKNQLKSQGYPGPITDCEVLEEILFEKLLLNQAKVDSVEVTDDMINAELDKRLNVFIRQIGSEEALEEYYGKSISEIREDFFDVLKDQILVQRMEGQISSLVNVTPGDVEAFYKSIPEDSIPFVNASVEIAQIAIFPEATTEEKERLRERLRKFKEQVERGEDDFETLAALYSDDPGSASKGGNLGMQPRGTFVPEFDAVAFKLKDGEISAPFKTDYGFHIMQMIERRGEMYNANHILLIPKINSEQLSEAKQQLDSVRVLVLRDSVSFALAAAKYSSDERTKNQNGMMVNPKTGSTIYEMDELDPTVFLAIDTLEIGEISNSVYFQGTGRERGYRILKLISRTKPHRANMQEDYQLLQNMASQFLKADKMKSWMERRISETYIKVNDAYTECSFQHPWIKEENNVD
jgi:peptidyl-prolyl cis-trans isomerase SurA